MSRINPKEVFFVLEIAAGFGGGEEQIDVEAFYDADSTAERLDFRTKDLFNDMVDQVNGLDEDWVGETTGMERDEAVHHLERAKFFIDQGEYQAALDHLSQVVIDVMLQDRWTTEVLHAEELK